MIIWEAPKSNDRCFCDRHPREEKAMVLWSVAECSDAAMSPGISGQPPEAGRSKERILPRDSVLWCLDFSPVVLISDV